MKNTTLCYITRGDQVLMLHRVKKEHDLTIVNPICKAEWVNAWTKTFDVWYRASGETVKQMEAGY